MAILSNINDLFRVDSAGAVYFATSAGANLQVLQSVGTGGSPIWVDVDDIIGGPYLPLAGGTLTGNLALTDATNNPSLVISTGSLTVGGNATFSSAVFTGGKLGVGTSDPGAEGYSYAEDLVILGGNSASDGAGITIRNNGKRYSVIAFGNGAGATGNDNDGEIYYDQTNKTMNFRTNHSPIVTFTNVGKVVAATATVAADSSNTLTTKGYVDGLPQGDLTAITVGNGLTGTSLSGPIPDLTMSGSYTGTFTTTAVATDSIVTSAGSLVINNPLDQNSNLIIGGRYDLGATTLSFRSGHGGNSNVWDMATIHVEDDSNYNGRIMFKTSPASYGNTPTTKMTIRSSGAIAFGTGISDYGSSGQILKSNGNTSPTWVDASTVIGGPYVTLGTAQTITASKTFSTLTYFTASESIRLKGARGTFTNEFMHLYNKVGIGNPAGWGQGETSTPNQGLSTYGAGYFAYGTRAASTFLGDLTVSKGTPIIKALDGTNNHYLLIAADTSNSFMRSDNNLLLQVDGGNVTALTFDNVGSATFSGYTYFPNYLFHAGDTNTRIFFETGKITLRGDTNIILSGGDVGIGTTGPSVKLEVANKSLTRHTNSGWGQAAIANPNDSEVGFVWGAGGTGYPGLTSTYTRQWIAGLSPFGTGTDKWSLTNKTLGAATAVSFNEAGDVAFGTTDITSDLSFGDRIMKIYGTRATLGLFSTGSLSTISMKASNNSSTAMHLNLDGSVGDLSIYAYAGGGELCRFIGATKRFAIQSTTAYSTLQVGSHMASNELTIGGLYSTGGGSLNWRSGHPSNSAVWNMARINVTDDGNYNGRMEFKTTTSGGNGGTEPTIKMVLKANGRLGIGTTSPDYQLDVENSSSAIVRIHAGVNSSASLRLKNDAQDWDVNTQTNDTFAIFNQTAGTQPFSILPNGNVGINKTNPLNKLHVDGNIQIGGWTTAGSRYVGTARIDNGTWANGAAGMEVESVTESGQGNYDQKVHLISHRYNGGTSRVLTASWTTGNNRVGIGDATPSYTLDVAGTIRATGDVIAYSDARVKDNVKTIDNALDKITKLRGVSYTRNDIEDKSTKIGVIAQEVLEVLPEVVSKDDEGKYSVSYGNIVGVLIEAIKELEARVKELENK